MKFSFRLTTQMKETKGDLMSRLYEEFARKTTYLNTMEAERVARDGLMRAAAEGRNSDFLMSRLEDLAAIEAEAAIYGQVDRILDAGEEQDWAPEFTRRQIRKYIFREAVAGADDTWSGRRNDLRRVEFDGKKIGIAHVDAWLNQQEKE